MNKQHEWQLEQYRKQEREGLELVNSARKSIDKLMLSSATDSGIKVGDIVTNSKRGDKMSVTHFSIEHMDKIGHFVNVYGVPLTQTGRPRENLETTFVVFPFFYHGKMTNKTEVLNSFYKLLV